MCYSDEAPYQLLQNRDIDFSAMQRVQRFARYWDLIANSGRFQHSLPLLLFKGGLPVNDQIADGSTTDESFYRFMKLSDWLFETTAQTHKIAYNRLLALVLEGAIAAELSDSLSMHLALAADCQANGDAHPPRWLREHMQPNAGSPGALASATPSRQSRHLATNSLPD